MAKRRMLDTETVESDDFYELPPMAQTLYFHLNMNADDDGLIARTGNIMRLCNAAAEDLELLIERGWLIRFESGLFAIRHWKMHNYIPKDRYQPSRHKAEKSQLELDDSMRYRLLSPPMYTEGRTDEDRSGEDRIGEDRADQVRAGEEERVRDEAPHAEHASAAAAPTLTEVLNFAQEQGLSSVNAYRFFEYYQGRRWRTPTGYPIDWKLKIQTWNQDDTKINPSPHINPPPYINERRQSSFDVDDFFAAALRRSYADMEHYDVGQTALNTT